jgi:hypothetical protein
MQPEEEEQEIAGLRVENAQLKEQLRLALEQLAQALARITELEARLEQLEQAEAEVGSGSGSGGGSGSLPFVKPSSPPRDHTLKQPSRKRAKDQNGARRRER